LHHRKKAIIAKCNPRLSGNPSKCLFLKDLTAVRLLARRLLQVLAKEQTEHCLMNRFLLLANAVALTVLVGFHFIPQHNEDVAQRMPHYLQVQKAPQWAVLSDQHGFAAQDVSEPDQAPTTQMPERLVF